MTTVSPHPDPTPPAGATPDLWIEGQRDVYAQIGHIPTSTDLLQCPTVTVVAEQFVDGRLGCVDIILDVAMGISHGDLSRAQSRELAALLIEGADLADRWAGTAVELTPVEHLANAFASLRVASAKLSDQHGLADDYVQAAIDSIHSAVEVLR